MTNQDDLKHTPTHRQTDKQFKMAEERFNKLDLCCELELGILGN